MYRGRSRQFAAIIRRRYPASARCINALPPMSSYQEDDFDYICNLATGCSHERDVDTALPALTDKASAPSAVGDITTVCDVLCSLPKRSFEERSWQLAERMRNGKRQKNMTAIRKPSPTDVAI